MKERINWIDWAKSICMFLVVFAHCHITDEQRVITLIIYSFHMPLFFFLSGILCKNKRSLYHIRKDLLFIILPYYTYGIIDICKNCLITKQTSYNVILNSLQLLIVGKDISIGPIWFLFALFFCKQIFRFLHFRSTFNYYTIAILILSVIITYIIDKYNINIPLFADSALFGFPFFIIGHFSNSITNRLKSINTTSRVLILLMMLPLFTVCSICNGYVILADCIYGNNIFQYYCSAILGISIIVISSTLLEKQNIRFVTTFAYGTIVTLGFHGMLLQFFQYYLPKSLGIYAPTYPISIAFVNTIITCTLCYLMIRIINASKIAPLFGLKGKKILTKQKQ